ncbi:acetyl-CoA carboxylase biotin carboxyl carrier protein [bacterium]|nr:acetyl-CoA carboxylase biotin carboxyl carrier protein [bacterium]
MRVDEIQQLIRLLEENEDIGEIELSTSPLGWRRLRVARRHLSVAAAALPPPPATERGPASPEAAATVAADLHTLKAPMVGTFFRSPSPEAEPFVSEGSKVSPGAVLCIIEAMKLMNEIESDVAGTIREILVENGQAVEFGQPLFLIERR